MPTVPSARRVIEISFLRIIKYDLLDQKFEFFRRDGLLIALTKNTMEFLWPLQGNINLSKNDCV